MANKRYVIIGDGAAGLTAARYIRKADAAGEIHMLSDDPNPGYFRAALTNYLIGELREDQIWAVPPTYYSELGIKRVLQRVSEVDTKNARLRVKSGGDGVAYDKLLIASGSFARQPGFPGGDLPGVMTMRTLQDVRQVMDLIKLKGLKQAAVVGGGPLALEWAQGLNERGVKVTIILRGDHFMKNALDKTGSDLLLARLRLGGVEVLLNEEVEEALPDNEGNLTAVRTKSGQKLDCDLLGVAIGVIPNTEFLEGSGIKTGRGGVEINAQAETSVENVYAAGDVVDFKGQGLRLWEPAQQQGRIAGYNMAGREHHYKPGAHYMATRLYDLDFASLGGMSEANGAEELIDMPSGTGKIAYRRLLVEKGKLKEAQLLGERSERVRWMGRAYKRLMDEGIDVSEVKDRLLDRRFNIHNWLEESKLVEAPRPVSLILPSTGMMRRPQSIEMPKVKIPAPEKVPSASLANTATGKVVSLQRNTALGRARDNDIVLDETIASGYHAEIRWQGTGFFVVDLGSTNGTFINGRRIDEAQAVNDGDELRFGNTTFSFATAVMKEKQERQLSSVHLGTMQLSKPVEMEAGERDAYLEAEDGQKFALSADVNSIGRDAECEIALESTGVSHLHAQITVQDGRYFLQDVGSRNGTWVNSELVSVPHELQASDEIYVGTISLWFRDSSRQAAPTPERREEKAAADQLVVRDGRGIGLKFKLEGKSLTVGRNPDSDIWLEDSSVSWEHAKLEKKADGWHITDLGSTNGTHIDEERLPEKKAGVLKPDSVLVVGRVEMGFAGERARPARTEVLERPDDAPELRCTHCGEPLKAASKFCPSCGEPVETKFVPAVVHISGGDEDEQTVELEDTMMIGRDGEACQVVLKTGAVSGRHLEIEWREDGYYARDLGSTNGTTRNGEPLGEEAVKLGPDDELILGKKVTLIFQEKDR